ncbi:alpha/beta hydrolase [Flavobacterium aquidurense]|uniref:carboxylesterase family protein n=1 Tax=Flavobacterium aquidurense TaxID=362413 RepID=UPI00091F0038|nr:prolyl oligopeptidase family serine peptidase [Flavobacterium aquidurense]OXA74053.1 alpha/beta hydrolase [Flavobacterium aquidurense]SHG56599.1 Prolyl oligopeptidase family protein [Flavobacterium frigidimaris]
MKKGLTFFLIALSVNLIAQTKTTGNVVEYFGKEKIVTTAEGSVLYHFVNGYTLAADKKIGTLFNGQDAVAWQYAVGKFVNPDQQKGDWQPVKVDSVGVFSQKEMKSAFLFTAYNSPKEQIVLLETTGGTRTYINGLPHEGDHYDFGYTLIPFKLRKGINEFVYTKGRFGRVKSQIIVPAKSIQFTKRDMTLPDIINGENDEKWASIRIINATEKELKNLVITTKLSSGETVSYTTDAIMPLFVRKVKFKIPAAKSNFTGEVKMKITLTDKSGKVIDETEITIQQRSGTVHHERTFISKIDNSVQYYSVAPASESGQKALILSVHGASVEARNQARAYKQKDWAHIVAATNRRPFGFNWEDWGRIDALEVLAEAKKVFNTVPAQTYLTGHSMGGHGTWFLGTTYPDQFAAIAPCASYPDIATYGSDKGDEMHDMFKAFEPIRRSANSGRVKSIIQNLKQSGVYILHGDADSTVPISQVREMRQILGTFHPNFCYYEYPGGEHWYGDHSVDWPPIFEFFKRQTIPANKEVREIDFHTATPAVSATDYWVKLQQQIRPFDFSTINAKIDKEYITVKTKNVAIMELDLISLNLKGEITININDQILKTTIDKKAILALQNTKWTLINEINTDQKYAERQGGFKFAFNNNVVFVYATGGSAAEREWYLNRARFDAETFYYRSNGSIDVISDNEFSLEKYKDRNVVLYGNAANNSAWKLLLKNAPVQIDNQQIKIGNKVLKGDDLAAYFVLPRKDSKTAMVGVVAGTSEKGMKATWANNYISGITGFPDVMIFKADLLLNGLPNMKVSGFFDNDWSANTLEYFN